MDVDVGDLKLAPEVLATAFGWVRDGSQDTELGACRIGVLLPLHADLSLAGNTHVRRKPFLSWYGTGSQHVRSPVLDQLDDDVLVVHHPSL